MDSVDWHDVTPDVITDVQKLLSAPRLIPTARPPVATRPTR
jgi:hypothetical protein